MFLEGEYLVHPGQGVCRVIAESEEGLELLPVLSRHDMHLKVPADMCDRLRPLVSAQRATELICAWETLDAEPVKEKSVSLEEQRLRKMVKQGECLSVMRVLKTLIQRMQEGSRAGRKPSVVYERLFKLAQERLITELSLALDENPSDIADRLGVEEKNDLLLATFTLN